MGALLERIRKLFLNRNTVTILAVFAGVIVLWLVYSATLSKAVDPVKVPVANKDLVAGTQITSDDFDMVEINSEALKKASVYTSSTQIVGQYINNGTSISKGAMFYQEQVVTKDKLIERDLETIPEGYRMYWLAVDNTTTYANSIYPGDKIDLWLKTETDDGKKVYEEFISNIEVIAVKDADGADVFATNPAGKPARLSFAVYDEMYSYLKAVENITGMTLYPVPINKSNSDASEDTRISNNDLVTLIDVKARLVNTDLADDDTSSNNTEE